MSGPATGFLGLTLDNPTVVASGILGISASSAMLCYNHGAAAVTLKSCCLEPRKGHPGPSIIPQGRGIINAVGLSNPGAEATAREIEQLKQRTDRPVFASIFGKDVEEFAQVAGIIASSGADLIEVNISCPNVQSEFGLPFAFDLDSSRAITAAVKAASGLVPVSIKLSPNVPSIGALGRACEEAGADALTAINTVGPGMIIDPEVRLPVLSNKVGGLSGPGILPIAVRAVWDLYRAVRIPIIGTGGVCTAGDALQLILAGATLVGIGSGVHFQGIGVFDEVAAGLREYLDDNHLDSLGQIRGAAHG